MLLLHAKRNKKMKKKTQKYDRLPKKEKEEIYFKHTRQNVWIKLGGLFLGILFDLFNSFSH